MTTIITAQQIADQLNSYEGDNIWQDVIVGLDAYDAEATEEADPNGQSTIVVLVDGTQVRHDGTAWYVA